MKRRSRSAAAAAILLSAIAGAAYGAMELWLPLAIVGPGVMIGAAAMTGVIGYAMGNRWGSPWRTGGGRFLGWIVGSVVMGGVTLLGPKAVAVATFVACGVLVGVLTTRPPTALDAETNSP